MFWAQKKEKKIKPKALRNQNKIKLNIAKPKETHTKRINTTQNQIQT